MRQIIIGLHGLGNKPPKKLLKKWWKDAMKEGLSNAGLKVKLPRFELIYWADILYDKPMDIKITDKNNPLFLSEGYIKGENIPAEKFSKTRQKVLSFIEGSVSRIFMNDDYSPKLSGITDSLLKKYFSDLHVYYNSGSSVSPATEHNAKHLIRERASKIIKKYRKYDIFFVTHSMGSIIAFDILKFIIPEIKINTFVTIGSPLGLPVVLSRIAAENKLSGNENSGMCTPPGIYNRWYNFSDPRDRVAFDFMLADDFCENSSGIKPLDFIVSNNYRVDGEKNPHKSYGYLRTPEFAAVLEEFILNRKPGIMKRLYRYLLGKILVMDKSEK